MIKLSLKKLSNTAQEEIVKIKEIFNNDNGCYIEFVFGKNVKFRHPDFESDAIRIRITPGYCGYNYAYEINYKESEFNIALQDFLILKKMMEKNNGE